MRLKYTSLAVLCFCIFFHFTIHASNSVEWSARIDNNRNGTATLIVTGTIADGWYLYTANMPAEGAEPLSFHIDNIEGATLTGDFTVSGNSSKEFDNIFKMKLDRYTDSVSASIPLKTTEGNHIKVSGSVLYMASNEEGKFLPPSTAKFDAEGGAPAVDSSNTASSEKAEAETSTPHNNKQVSSTVTATSSDEQMPDNTDNSKAIMTYIGVLALFTATTFGLCIYLLIQVIKLKKREN